MSVLVACAEQGLHWPAAFFLSVLSVTGFGAMALMVWLGMKS